MLRFCDPSCESTGETMSFGNVKQNIVLLTASNLIIGLIEFVFNMYLSRILGAEGLGVLSLIAPINSLFLSFMTEGLVVTISKMSAAHQYQGNSAAMDSMIRISTAFSFFWSLLVCGLVRLTAEPIASGFLGDAALKAPILAVCPLMLLMSVSNIIKGTFWGFPGSRCLLPSISAKKSCAFPYSIC